MIGAVARKALFMWFFFFYHLAKFSHTLQHPIEWCRTGSTFHVVKPVEYSIHSTLLLRAFWCLHPPSYLKLITLQMSSLAVFQDTCQAIILAGLTSIPLQWVFHSLVYFFVLLEPFLQHLPEKWWVSGNYIFETWHIKTFFPLHAHIWFTVCGAIDVSGVNYFLLKFRGSCSIFLTTYVPMVKSNVTQISILLNVIFDYLFWDSTVIYFSLGLWILIILFLLITQRKVVYLHSRKYSCFFLW